MKKSKRIRPAPFVLLNTKGVLSSSPGFASLRATLGTRQNTRIQPQRGCVHLPHRPQGFRKNGRNTFGVDYRPSCNPRVARKASQPWAGRRNRLRGCREFEQRSGFQSADRIVTTHRSLRDTVRHSVAPKGHEANSPRFQPGDWEPTNLIKPRRGEDRGVPSPLRGFDPLLLSFPRLKPGAICLRPFGTEERKKQPELLRIFSTWHLLRRGSNVATGCQPVVSEGHITAPGGRLAARRYERRPVHTRHYLVNSK